MHKKFYVIVIVLCALSIYFPVFSQFKLSDWRTYSSLTNVRDVDFDGQKLWFATSGGAFNYDLETEDIQEFRNIEGLIKLNLTEVAFLSKDSSYYFGSKDGYIQILNSEGKFTYITDIVVAKYPDPEIRKIVFYGDKAIISGGFGITIFDTKEQVFLETASRFGNLTSEARINDFIIYNDTLWLITDNNLIFIKMNKSFSNPENWIVENEAFMEGTFKNIVYYEGKIYISTDNEIYRYDGSGNFTSLVTVSNGIKITDLAIYNNEVIFSTQFSVFTLDNQVIPVDYYNYDINSLGVFKFNDYDLLVMNYTDFAFSYLTKDGLNKSVIPNSPITNNFMHMDVDPKGRLWVATRSEDVMDGKGFMMLDNQGIWHNYTKVNDVPFTQSLKVKAMSNGEVYVSSWGSGLARLKEQGDNNFEMTILDTSNSPLTGAVTTALGYVIAGEVQEDYNGNPWMINYGESNSGPLLVTVDENNNFRGYANRSVSNERQYLELVIDKYGVKWLGSNKFSKGLYYFYDNNTPDDLSDDIYGILNTGNSELLDNEIKALAVDETGILWIGTSSGLNFIYDTYPVLLGNQPVVRQDFNLRNQFINDIYVDALNNKWIATGNGVWVLNSDATKLLNEEIINSSNSGLIDNNVVSITSNFKNGVIYFGTTKGLSTAKSLSVLPINEYNLRFYPQPFNPNINNEFIIDGLEKESSISIMSVDGTFIRKLNTQGKVAVWDGKDYLGKDVGNGVYIVVASSSVNGSGVAGKFAILRK